jgi:hypothetical protein
LQIDHWPEIKLKYNGVFRIDEPCGQVLADCWLEWTLLKKCRKHTVELRQKCYLEALHAAAILSNEKLYSADEILAAKKRFRELYVAELSMVEPRGVESSMVAVAEKIDSEIVPLKSPQKEVYDLAHALRDSFIKSWGVSKEDVHLSDTPKK